MFLTAAGTFETKGIPYGVKIIIHKSSNIIPNPNLTGVIPNNVTNENDTTSTPSTLPNSAPMSINYTVYFEDDITTDMKNFSDNQFDLTESMKPCTNYNFTVIANINGTSCNMGTSHYLTPNLGKLFCNILQIILPLFQLPFMQIKKVKT